MSDDFNEADEDTTTSNGGTLRSKLEAALAREKDLNAKFEALNKEVTGAKRGALLEEKGVPAKARKLYTGEATAEAVDAFIEEYGELWGLDKQDLSPEAAARQAAQEKVQQASAGGAPANKLEIPRRLGGLSENQLEELIIQRRQAAS